MYLLAVELGVNRFVVPTPPLGHWWTIPALVMNAVEAGVVEEGDVLGYLITRLQQLSWPAVFAVGASALLRGTYHLYQGWGGSPGNVAMGALFGYLFLRWGEAYLAVRGRPRAPRRRRRCRVHPFLRDRLPGFDLTDPGTS